MRKPNLLRAWLLRHIHEIEHRPDQLHIFIEEGRIEFSLGDSLSYRYCYKLVLVLEDWAHPSEGVFVPLLAWLQTHQPDVFSVSGAIKVKQDILSETATDIEITLMLDELARVEAIEAGGWRVSFPAEPVDNWPNPPALLHLVDGISPKQTDNPHILAPNIGPNI